MTSLDHLVAPPPLAALASLLLLAGTDWLGLRVLQALRPAAPQADLPLRGQAVVVGAMVLAAVLYPLVLADAGSRAMLRVLAFALAASGAAHLVRCAPAWPALARRARGWVRQAPAARGLVVAIAAMLALLALAPVTSADALDYHMGAAIAILLEGGMPDRPEWFHSRLAGSGEVLNALGLALGAEQFGTLLQAASLAAVAALLWPQARAEAPVRHAGRQDHLLLVAVSAPVLLFLVSGPKPQLWPAAMTTLAFALMAHPALDGLHAATLRRRFALACALCMTAAGAKFSFLLGGGIAGALALYLVARRGQALPALAIGAGLAVAILLPPVAWKAHAYDASLLDSLLSPLPGHLPGTDRMLAFARHNPDVSNAWPFPLSLLVPSQAGGLSVVLGLSWVVVFWLRPARSPRLVAPLVAVVAAVLATALLAPPAARMYMEPFFWALFLCRLQAAPEAAPYPAPVRWLALAQGAGFALACGFGALTLFPGALWGSWRDAVMDRAANGHALLRWVDRALPPDAVLLNGHRSMALAPRKALDYSWTRYVDPASEEASRYLERLKAEKVTHVLVADRAIDRLPLGGCFGRLHAGPGPGKFASRSPFHPGATYDAWLFEFDASRLPGCARPRVLEGATR